MLQSINCASYVFRVGVHGFPHQLLHANYQDVRTLGLVEHLRCLFSRAGVKFALKTKQ
jgi:hypothetical protein